MTKSKLKRLVLAATTGLLEASPRQRAAVLEDIIQNGSDSDHGLDGDTLAKDLLQAAVDNLD